jgi:phosphoglycerol transferase MdoB-like AlkP superfamily enzyme
MDATPLQYFKNPAEMGASVSSSPVILLLSIFLVFAFLFTFLYLKVFDRYINNVQHQVGMRRHKQLPDPIEILADRNHKQQFKKRSTNKGRKSTFSVWHLAFSLLLLAILFIPIRGGIQKIPINISDVYFSEKLFADHAAINLPWNIMFSILNKNDNQNPFKYFPKNEAKSLVDSLYNTGPLRIPSILGVEKPNVIIIILESFTAKWVGSLGGVPGVTPQLDKIAEDGLSFTKIYAAGDRSEKGLTAILSGYPNQAITSIIKTPEKNRELPSINIELKKNGYQSSYTYGGELEFANIKSYLINTGFQKLTDKYVFPLAQRTTSWGVHDEFVLNHFQAQLQKEKQPFFATLFTLSSHEPYNVPLHHFTGKDETTEFKNSIFYTDSIIGSFINKAKSSSWWNNTLIIFVADHGHPLPGNDANDVPSKFHIPLIFSGGALKLKGTIDNIGSQTDIATTLLHQLHLPTTQFKYGKDLLDSSARQFAFYSFNNGFGFVTPKGTETIDNVSGKTIFKSPGYDTSQIKFGKAYMQDSYEDFLRR